MNSGSETNECLLRILPLAIRFSTLQSKDDLFAVVQLYCGFTHSNEIVIEGCYLYCYAIKLLIVDGWTKSQAYELMREESERRARLSGCSTIKHWIENDIDVNDVSEMPIPHYRPVSYIKTPLLWAFYYLKNDY